MLLVVSLDSPVSGNLLDSFLLSLLTSPELAVAESSFPPLFTLPCASPLATPFP
ncbi:hypothetical protein ACO1DJ_12500 [Staphylococcus epidermidis]|uniref:hypothetical protein n=1 Tax=Staphylococcus epidermidis TaxID=1282 RepID=UPI003BF6A013